ncbi:MAG: SRPBCC domain-containing protein [Ferruginibacter sp.]
MTTANTINITVATTVNVPVEKAWQFFTAPQHITQWNNASGDWHTPKAVNDLQVGGKFLYRMEAKDGSFGFDFGGVYDEVKTNQLIAYSLDDGRKVKINFTAEGSKTKLVETFDAETENSIEIQRGGWQSILDNFKKYAEYCNIFEPLYFSITINAPKGKVWNTMLDAETYKQWTAAAWPGSYYEGTWKQGETLCFFSPDRSGTKVKLLEHRPYTFSLAEHIAVFEKGTEIREGELAKTWIGSKESYSFTEQDGKARLDIVMYITKDWQQMFINDWPKALGKLKEICEA